MDIIIKLFKNILWLISLIESWINYYHKQKKIVCVGLSNVIFIVFLDLLITPFTYIIIYMANMKLLLSLKILFSIYFVILFIITFQNITDVKFNIASKVKLLVLSIIDNLTIKQIAKDFILFCLSWAFISTLVIIFIYKQVLEIADDSILNLIFMITFSINFFIHVYGINNSNLRNKRKLLLYGISILIT